MAAYQSGYTGAEIDTAIYNINNFVNLVYPVGSIYISVNSTSPSVLFGGTWEMINEKFLFAGSSANYPYGSTGGAATVTLTTSQMPAHTHSVGYTSNSGNYVPQNSTALKSFRIGSSTYTPSINGVLTDINPTGYTSTNFNQSTGGGAAHNNMPPYLSVYMWKRTA